MKLNSKDHNQFILALFGKLLEKNGTKVHILKEKDKNYENIELSSIQALCALYSQKKYNIHFDFGEVRNLEILKSQTKQKYFLDEYKKKISGILKIDMNRIIFRDVRYGTTDTTFSIIDQSLQEDTDIERIKQIENVVEIEKKSMIDELVISPDILDTKGDRHKGWGINEKRGGEKYIPPLDGWVGIGLKVIDKYENNNWLDYKNLEGEYSIAYYGLNNYLNEKYSMINDINYFVEDITKIISEREFQTEDDIRTGFLGFFRGKCGGGVCLFQDPKFAENSAGTIHLCGIDYKMIIMCRVNPKKIRQPKNHENYWILNPTPDEIRPYRILLKKVVNFPLLDNKLITYSSPVDYILNAIKSNNFEFYDLKTDDRFNNRIGHEINNGIIGKLYENEIFIIRFYSSMYFIPINYYMFKSNEGKGIVLDTFESPCGCKETGFSKSELDSAICCLQHVLKKNKNVENGTIVYRGISNKFPENMNIGSKFYFSAFISTSTDIKIADEFRKEGIKKNGEGGGTLMKIFIHNNGTDRNHPNYCLNIENYSLSPEQKEILICSHCYFEIIKMKRSDDIDYVDLVCKGYLLDN